MSYGAGGVGLNLQFAHYVFLFDRWWNPAVEDQAINRAHRIGVSGPVTSRGFSVLDTIEERIDRILQEKRELFETIFSGAEAPHKLGLTKRSFGLFHFQCPAGAIAGRRRGKKGGGRRAEGGRKQGTRDRDSGALAALTGRRFTQPRAAPWGRWPTRQLSTAQRANRWPGSSFAALPSAPLREKFLAVTLPRRRYLCPGQSQRHASRSSPAMP